MATQVIDPTSGNSSSTTQTVTAIPTTTGNDVTISANNIYFGSQFNTNQPATIPTRLSKVNQEAINLGVTKNDGKGDSFRVAFEKINNNFSTLFKINNQTTSSSVKPDLITISNNLKSKGDSLRIVFQKINKNFTTLFSEGTTNTELLSTFNTEIFTDLQEIINLGKVANDGLGDPVMTAFQKTNNNFSTLFAFAPITKNEIVAPSKTVNTEPNVSGNITINATNLYLNNLPKVQTTTAVEYSVSAGPYGAQEYINIGAQPNDGEGDPLRVAFGKINNNFSNLFYTTTNTYTVYSVGTDPDQLILAIPVDTFTQGNFQIRSSIENTGDSQDIIISAQITNDNLGVKYTGYGTTFSGDPVTRYSMDVVDGNVVMLVQPLQDEVILHFIAAQTTYIGNSITGLNIGLNDYVDSVMATENDFNIITEN
jgi:hypothetical protein